MPLENKDKKAKLPINIILTIFSILLFMITIVAYSFYLGSQMNAKVAPLIDATTGIQLEATKAHLWFEEMISGDQTIKIDEVLQYIDNSLWYASAMLEGDTKSDIIFIPLDDPTLRANINEVLNNIHTFRKITLERLKAIETSGIGTPIDQKYDAVFMEFQRQADVVQKKLHHVISSEQGRFRSLQFILVFSLILSSIALLFTFYKYEKQKAKDIKLIQDAQDRIKILSGLLPICAACKKIRDNNGSWTQIEAYISYHSEAEFSHGICPDCASELYPQFYSKVKSD